MKVLLDSSIGPRGSRQLVPGQANFLRRLPWSRSGLRSVTGPIGVARNIAVQLQIFLEVFSAARRPDVRTHAHNVRSAHDGRASAANVDFVLAGNCRRPRQAIQARRYRQAQARGVSEMRLDIGRRLETAPTGVPLISR